MISHYKLRQVLTQVETVKIDSSDTPYKISPEGWTKIQQLLEILKDQELYKALKDAREFARTVARVDAPTNFSTEAKTYLQRYYGEKGLLGDLDA